MKKKRSFLLLEVLISVALVALFAPLLMKLPICHYQKQIENLEMFERQRISDWTFSEVKEFLLKLSIPWKDLPEKKDPPLHLPLSDVNLEIPEIYSRPISRSFSMQCTGEKDGNKGELFRLYEITIYLEGDPLPKKDEPKIARKYRLLVQKLPSAP